MDHHKTMHRITRWTMIMAVASAAQATLAVTLDPAVQVIVGTRPAGIAVGDFNADTHADWAVTSDNPDKVSIFINDGSGNFAAGPVVALPASSSPGELVAGDLDGDTDMDLAIALRDFNTVIIVTNNDGAFSAGSQFATGANPRGMSIADMDGDNDLDIAVANRDSNDTTVLENTGGGVFTSTHVPVGTEPRDAAFGDFDGDNRLDVAVTNHDDRTISIVTNMGSGSFAATATLFVGGQVRPDGIVAADLDGDLDIDLATATSGQNGTINNASVFLNAAGTFSGPFDYPVGGVNPSRIVAADFDCDTMLDLATANTDSGDVSILPNIGGGAFGAATTSPVGTSPETLAAAGLDGDSDPDLVATNRDSDDVSVIVNQTCAEEIPADIDGDGDVDLDDLTLLLQDFGCGMSCLGDVDGDDDTDLDDLTLVLQNFGA